MSACCQNFTSFVQQAGGIDVFKNDTFFQDVFASFPLAIKGFGFTDIIPNYYWCVLISPNIPQNLDSVVLLKYRHY